MAKRLARRTAVKAKAARTRPRKRSSVASTTRRATTGTPRKKPASRPNVSNPRPTIFISYRHEAPTTDIAQRLRAALLPPAKVWKADVFMDSRDVEPGTLFDKEIMAALDRTTHFIVLLTNAYWNSPYCQKELQRAMRRFGRSGSVLPLFVKAEEVAPATAKYPLTLRDE